ncbi:MAG TPA: hypothetical protein VKE92_11855 [Anaerolineales bacterium]|jgi:hypothetical protein|nr:hypothetical protein [Anaerolineales bacterium]
MEFNIPHAMQVEHEELHVDLEKAIASGGETGAAAREVAEALHSHFESEERYALPPLGLLPALAEGRISSEMTQVLEMTDTLKAELPRMLDEHKLIVDALQKLIGAARKEKKMEHIHFAEKLMLHAQNEEEVSYPTAILIGEYVKLKLGVH